jgi:hypothetical protein
MDCRKEESKGTINIRRIKWRGKEVKKVKLKGRTK